DGLPALRLGMCEAQEPLDEPLLALDRLEDADEVLLRTVAVREVGLQELHESPKGGERRSHLVRDPRRHPAEQLELVGPLALLPDAPLLRRIAPQQPGPATGLSPGLALDRDVDEERCPGLGARMQLFALSCRYRL